jgi:hypothetical protein
MYGLRGRGIERNKEERGHEAIRTCVDGLSENTDEDAIMTLILCSIR